MSMFEVFTVLLLYTPLLKLEINEVLEEGKKP